MRRDAIVIPEAMRAQVLDRVHDGHLGQTKNILRARGSVYWPGITAAIKQRVENCQGCQVYQHRNPNSETGEHEDPEEPWSKVGLDLFELNGRHYLLVVDYTSNYPEVHRLEELTSRHIILGLKSIFARHGIPIMVVRDNDPKISGSEIRAFYRDWGITFNPSSPLYPQSNGMAERSIQTVKRILKKSFLMEDDPYLSLLAYRATAVDGTESPAEKLMHRKLRTTVPNFAKEVILEQIKPQPYTRYEMGDTVNIYNEKTKRFDRQGVIVGNPAPKSATIQTASRQYRRNERDVRKSTTSLPAMITADDRTAEIEAVSEICPEKARASEPQDQTTATTLEETREEKPEETRRRRAVSEGL